MDVVEKMENGNGYHGNVNYSSFRKYHNGEILCFKKLLHKNMKTGYLSLFIAVLISTPYINIEKEMTQKTIQNMQGFMYLIITETVFTYSYSVLHTFPKEIPTFLREISNGLYSTGPYYLSKMIIMLPRSIIEPFVFTMFVFWIAGLQGTVFLFSVPIIMCATTATAYGTLMSAAFESVSTAALVSVPIDQIGIMFCGIYLQLYNLPKYIYWIKFLSQFYYGQEAVSIIQWHQITDIECNENPTLPCISTGDGVLNKYGYHYENFAIDLLGLATIYFVAHLFGYLAILKRSKKQPVY